MGHSKLEDPKPSSWRRFREKFSSERHNLSSEQPQEVDTRQVSHHAAEENLPPSPAGIPPNDATDEQPTELKGLWTKAYEKLLQDKRNVKLIEAYKTALLQEASIEKSVSQNAAQDESDISPRLQSLIEHRFEEIKNSQTKFKLAGNEIILKDQVRKAVDVILSVQSVVTTAVSS
jgi:N-terminal domain of NWD NACHT-NTPase